MGTTKSIADQFRARSRTSLTLPSGITIIARKADFTRLMQLGLLPDSLGQIVAQAIALQTSRRGGKAPVGNTADLGQQISDAIMGDPKGMFAMQDAMVKACGIEPRFVDVVKDPDTEVAIEDVEPEDKQFIMQWAQGGTHSVETFRAQQQRNVPAGSEGEAVRAEAVSPAAD